MLREFYFYRKHFLRYRENIIQGFRFGTERRSAFRSVPFWNGTERREMAGFWNGTERSGTEDPGTERNGPVPVPFQPPWRVAKSARIPLIIGVPGDQ